MLSLQLVMKASREKDSLHYILGSLSLLFFRSSQGPGDDSGAAQEKGGGQTTGGSGYASAGQLCCMIS